MYIYAPTPTPAPPLSPTLPIRGSSLPNKLACLQRAAFSGITFLSGSKDHVGLSDCLTRHCGGGGGELLRLISRSRPGNVYPILLLMDWNKRVCLWCGEFAILQTQYLISRQFFKYFRHKTKKKFRRFLLLITTSSLNFTKQVNGCFIAFQCCW